MKRAVIFLILFAMILHCSTRLGLMTWLYQNRQSITYSIGLLDEPHITVCSHEAEMDRLVEITVNADETDKLPVTTFQVREINLFFEFNFTDHSPDYALLGNIELPVMVEPYYQSPDRYIFHPPA